MKCYVCDTEITTINSTEEHIIINAIGGRLKSRKLICVKCNTELGETIDAVLAKQLNSLANMLMINRERGEPQPIMSEKLSTGENILIEFGGTLKQTKPFIDKKSEKGTTNISIEARSEKELRGILKGYAKKYPHFDVEEAVNSAKWIKEYVEEPLHFDTIIGGKKAFRAICKCATNFFILNQGESKYIKHLIPYIKGIKDEEIVWFHFKENLYELSPNESFHILHLVGNPTEKVLYCYVDYFNACKYIVLLNDSYDGEIIRNSYVFDLINGKTIEKNISIDYHREELLDFFINKDAQPFENATKSFQHTFALGYKRQDDSIRNDLIAKSVNESFKKHSEGEIITEEIFEAILKDMIHDLTPYLLRRLKNTDN